MKYQRVNRIRGRRSRVRGAPGPFKRCLVPGTKEGIAWHRIAPEGAGRLSTQEPAPSIVTSGTGRSRSRRQATSGTPPRRHPWASGWRAVSLPGPGTYDVPHRKVKIQEPGNLRDTAPTASVGVRLAGGVPPGARHLRRSAPEGQDPGARQPPGHRPDGIVGRQAGGGGAPPPPPPP